MLTEKLVKVHWVSLQHHLFLSESFCQAKSVVFLLNDYQSTFILQLSYTIIIRFLWLNAQNIQILTLQKLASVDQVLAQKLQLNFLAKVFNLCILHFFRFLVYFTLRNHATYFQRALQNFWQTHQFFPLNGL